MGYFARTLIESGLAIAFLAWAPAIVAVGGVLPTERSAQAAALSASAGTRGSVVVAAPSVRDPWTTSLSRPGLAPAASGGADGVAPTAAPAKATGGGTDGLAQQLNNPIASLISVPFQNNFNQSMGPEDKSGYQLNVNPVIPVGLSPSWNLISRFLIPILDQPALPPNFEGISGLGDITYQAFFSPAAPSKLTWGLGPIVTMPTGTRGLSSEKWSVGPAGVAVVVTGRWTVGLLATHSWSVAGDEAFPDVNLTFLQPFMSYNIPGGWSVGVQTETTYDWEADQWTVPLQASVGKLVKIGGLPVNIAVAPRWWAEGPPNAPEWSVRLIFTLLFPAK